VGVATALPCVVLPLLLPNKVNGGAGVHCAVAAVVMLLVVCEAWWRTTPLVVWARQPLALQAMY
jgi:hypothetical protein